MSYRTLTQDPDTLLPARLGDVRGQAVRGERNERLGIVRDLILDDADLRYLDIDAGGLLSPRRVLLPARFARMGKRGKPAVRLVGITRDQFRALPEWEGDLSTIAALEDHIDRALSANAILEDESAAWAVVAEEEARDAAAATDSARAVPRAFAADSRDTRRDAEDGALRVTRAEEEVSIHKRAAIAGEVVVRKTVEVEPRRIPVTRMRDDIQVERRAVEPGTITSFEPFEVGDELHIPVVEEEVVVQTRRVVREVVVVTRRSVEETVTAEAKVRKERVIVEERRND